MATKRPIEAFEESTRVHTSDQIGKILEQAQARLLASEEVNRDFEDVQEHTMVGNSQELAKQAMRSVTANVVKRSTLTNLPAVRAQGSANELRPPPVAATDDDAFGEWDESVTKKPTPPESQDVDIDDIDNVIASMPETPAEAPVIEAPPRLADMPVVVEPEVETVVHKRGAVQEVVAPEPTAAPKRKSTRWGVVAWFALLAAMIGAGSMAYLKINELERDLAAAHAQLRGHR